MVTSVFPGGLAREALQNPNSKAKIHALARETLYQQPISSAIVAATARESLQRLVAPPMRTAMIVREVLVPAKDIYSAAVARENLLGLSPPPLFTGMVAREVLMATASGRAIIVRFGW